MNVDRSPEPAPSHGPDTGVTCTLCLAPNAAICARCRRAAALRSWAGVENQPEAVGSDDVRCRLCGAGVAAYCALCWPDAVMAYRQGVLAANKESLGQLAEDRGEP